MIAKACNNEVHQMTVDHPERFAGLATLPMQDIPAAIAELERVVMQLGLKGAMINDMEGKVSFRSTLTSPGASAWHETCRLRPTPSTFSPVVLPV